MPPDIPPVPMQVPQSYACEEFRVLDQDGNLPAEWAALVSKPTDLPLCKLQVTLSAEVNQLKAIACA